METKIVSGVEGRDKQREIRITIRDIDKEGYQDLRKVLKERVFRLVNGIPCTVSVVDDENLDIRHKDGW